MDHQSFRFYIPGIVFLFPIYVASCWIITSYYDDVDLRQFVLIGGITVFPAISLPIGWFIYNIYRVLWLKLTHGGYENKEFNKQVNKDTKPFYCPLNNSILMDFSNILNNKTLLKFEFETFRHTFFPFTTKRKFYKEIDKKEIFPKFTEHLSDHILFRDSSYDYARSISSVRYGLESAFFALFLGTIYSFAIYFVWLHTLTNKYSFSIYIICFYLLIILSLFLITTLIIRWFYASKEYDARLNLISILSTRNEFEMFDIKRHIPEDLIVNIDKLNLSSSDYAAFDLDNTLLVGDIGEAVFAELLNRKKIESFNWTDYIKLLENDKNQAYKKVIEIMVGLKVEEIEKITLDILESDKDFIEIQDYKVPIPKPNIVMQAIIAYLRIKKIDIYVITASNQISAELTCWKFFGIPNSNVFGGKVNSNWNGKINVVSHVIPFAGEKVNVLKKIKKNRPIITGSDGIWDKYLIDFTVENGIRLWLGQAEKEYLKLKRENYSNLEFYNIRIKNNR